VVDDDAATCELVEQWLEQIGYDVEWRPNAADALRALQERDYDVVLSDLNMSEMSGLDLCRRIAENYMDLPVIVMTAFGNMAAAISALHAGATDFVNKPLDWAQLEASIAAALRRRSLREKQRRLAPVGPPVASRPLAGAESPAMRHVEELLVRVADADTTVMLSGESGSGKEVVARALHARSRRANLPFVAVNCAAVPPHLLEAELFGHVRGAFTDASGTRRGLFQEAAGGTLLLDEIGDMPRDMQPKLLRVLQERSFRPVGGNDLVPLEARVITATHRQLEDDVAKGRFREDLFFRLNVVHIPIPPLRERGADILALSEQFIGEFAARMRKPVQGVTRAAAEKLLAYDWPGNVRELRNSIERAVTLTRRDQIDLDDLPEAVTRHRPGSAVVPATEAPITLEQLEKFHIQRVLNTHRGNKTRAAQSLGIDRRTLYRMLDRHQAQAHHAARDGAGVKR